MDTEKFIQNIEPGNYFITKSMELTKVQTSGTLWYTKKFLVLYYYIFLSDNITTLNVAREIRLLFDDYINSLPENLREKAEEFFFASEDVADLRSDNFILFDDFAGRIQFTNDNERISYYESAKKYYFAFLMGSGGQSGVNAHIKNHLYRPGFCYSQIDNIIDSWCQDHFYDDSISHSSMRRYRNGDRDGAISAMRNDYPAFLRNERQILFYYGFVHSKSYGSSDREFSSLTPIGDLAVHSNFYELIAIWEHQKLKMLSQPVNIEICGLQNSNIGDLDHFTVNQNPYLTILKALKSTSGFTKEAYQYIISRLPQYPSDDEIDTTDEFIDRVKSVVREFNRAGDLTTEDFTKELLKYMLGVRNDMPIDIGCNPFGLCRIQRNRLNLTNSGLLNRLVEVYSILCNYKTKKYEELFQQCAQEIKRQYVTRAGGFSYVLNPKIKIDWDMYNIHTDLLILLSVVVLLLEAKNGIMFSNDSMTSFINGINELCPNILSKLGLNSIAARKKELKNLLNVFQDGKYEMYLSEDNEEYGTTVSTYLNQSSADLWNKIIEHSNAPSEFVEGIRRRDMTLISLIKSYNIKNHNGEIQKCECCGNPTFITYRDEYYVEYHHLIPFSEFDGPDHHLNILALCPMCHRKLHYLKQEDKHALYESIGVNSYEQKSIKDRLKALHTEHKLTSYQLEFLLADNAINQADYNEILQIA